MSITSLPPELLTHICQNLEPHNWAALRLTCHRIHDNTLEAYAKRYFRAFSVVLTRESLGRLEEIASSETLRHWVQEIWIIPNLFGGCPERDKEIFKSPSLEDGPRGALDDIPKRKIKNQAQIDAGIAVYKATSAAYHAFLHYGLFEVLEKCLSLLENATIVGVQPCPTLFLMTESYESFRCLGLRRLKNQLINPVINACISKSKSMQKMLALSPGLAFSQLVHAIIISSRHVQTLHTCGSQAGWERILPSFGCGMSLGSFKLAESLCQSLLPLLSDLTTLHMCIRVKDNEEDLLDEDNFQRLHSILLTVAPRLKSLTFSQWSPFEELSPLYFQDLSQRIRFSRLEDLHLQMIEVTVDTLKCFLKTAAPSLKRLVMRRVALADALKEAPDPGPLTRNSSSWGPSLSSEVITEIQELWSRIFEFLADHLQLEFLQLWDLGYRGRHVALEDDLYAERGQPNAHRSSDPKDQFFRQRRGERPRNTMMFYSSKDSPGAEKASVPFKRWVMQLRIRMVIPGPACGHAQLPGVSTPNFYKVKTRRAQPERSPDVPVPSSSSA